MPGSPLHAVDAEDACGDRPNGNIIAQVSVRLYILLPYFLVASSCSGGGLRFANSRDADLVGGSGADGAMASAIPPSTLGGADAVATTDRRIDIDAAAAEGPFRSEASGAAGADTGTRTASDAMLGLDGAIGPGGTIGAVVLKGTFVATGGMALSRMDHTATLLPIGKVLVLGAYGGSSHSLPGAELYDPDRGTFAATGAVTTPRYDHTATLLPGGSVLIAGGADVNQYGFSTASAEIYGPATENFRAVSDMTTARGCHTANLLLDGKVLLAGGGNPTGYLASAEMFDPSAQTFSAVGGMTIARSLHTATTLPDGKVLVAGGIGADSSVFASAELYDPNTRKFTRTGSMTARRYFHRATLLPNGKVLITGGADSTSAWPVSSAELYDPVAGTFVAAGDMTSRRLGHTATLLTDGKVLIAGGYGNGWLASAELYDETSGTFSATGPMTAVREWHTATLLNTGKVLLAGGEEGYIDPVATAELYE